MSKLTLPVIAIISAVVTLVSCIPPQYPPPPRFQPRGPYPPDIIAPQDRGDTIVAPDNSIQPINPVPPPAPPSATGGYPTATRVEGQPLVDPDQVISPYDPYNVIDVSSPRIPSGKLARDPTNRKIFRVP